MRRERIYMKQEKTVFERNWRFDYLKGICCVIVVLFHCPFPGIIGDAIIYGLRFPVPLFFMITGYYCYARNDAWIRRKAWSLLKLLLAAEMGYFAWLWIKTAVLEHQDFMNVLALCTSLNHPVRSILCGTFFCGVLWYLYAAFWTYLIYLLLRKTNFFFRPLLWKLTIALLVICLAAGRYYVQNHYDINELVYLFRNAVVFGLPMTLTGS